MEILLFLLIIGCMAFLLCKSISKEVTEEKHTVNTTNEQKLDQINQYSQFYQRKLLFTKNEYYEFMKLVTFAKANGLEVLAKVRLLDLIEPRTEYRRDKKYLYKIQAKHVDFVITNEKYKVITIIELDDNSHKKPERIERDIFINEVLKGTGYNVIHTNSITNEVLQKIHSMTYKNATPTDKDQKPDNRGGAAELIESRQG